MRIFAAFLLFTLHSTVSVAGVWNCISSKLVTGPFNPMDSQDKQSWDLAFPACGETFYNVCVRYCHEAGGEMIPELEVGMGYEHTRYYSCSKNNKTGNKKGS